jgi:carbamoyltransferase
MSLILGLNAYHADSSACLVRDGELVYAVEEERLRRIKHWAGFPILSIRLCLESQGLAIENVDHIALNRNPKANAVKKLGYTIGRKPSLRWLADRIRKTKQKSSVRDILSSEFNQPWTGKIHHVEHHLAHLASAFFVSPFAKATAVSIDGFGDFASAAWGEGDDATLSVDGEVYFPHSLGCLYEALTQYLGFRQWGDEYKVMGLAPYGEANCMDQLRHVVLLQEDGSYRLNLKYFRHHKENIQSGFYDGSPSTGTLFSPALEQLLGPARAKEESLEQHHKDIAASLQRIYEEAFFNLLNAVYVKYGNENLALAGGCAMNSVANGKIYQNTPFRRVYVQSAAGDAGGAIGAAYTVWHKVLNETRRSQMPHAYWGPAFSSQDIVALLRQRKDEIDEARCHMTEHTDRSELSSRTAAAIAAGKVVGWFQGRMEWGPRALGNRSILCDPRRADMKDILNAKIKRRESFRPFAPSILREAVGDWFEQDDDVPFMMEVFQIRPEKRALIPAVCHVDGSGRLQTVHQETNPLYYQLIFAFCSLTAVPLVLNTSFNENEPVVCRPEEALDCFLRTKMDVIVLENYFVERQA